MVKCPGCPLELPKDDLGAQIAHMEKFHPEIITARLRREGIHGEAEKFGSERTRRSSLEGD